MKGNLRTGIKGSKRPFVKAAGKLFVADPAVCVPEVSCCMRSTPTGHSPVVFFLCFIRGLPTASQALPLQASHTNSTLHMQVDT
jgi:hypothetical protein